LLRRDRPRHSLFAITNSPVRHLQSSLPFPALPAAGACNGKPPPAPLLAAAVHAQSEGVLIAARRWTTNGLRIRFANESFCAMTGYTYDELRERGHGFLHETKEDLSPLHRWQTSLKPGSILSGEGYLTRKDGARVYSSWNYSPVSDEGGRVTHIVATFRDLTEKRSLQEALVHSQRLDSVGRVAGGVAHDFNNLLSVIGGYCEIMASKRAVRRLVARELTEVYVASEKAAYLVGQLLAFSRRQPGGHRVVNLDKLIRGSSEILSRLMKPLYSLEFSLQAENANIRVDPAQIQQVLLNLVLNARDALMEGGVVTVASEVREACPGGSLRRNHAVLIVSDNGSGMSDEVRARIFEPFYTTKENGRGTGLGLTLVHSVIQQCGGFIQVTSAPGKGSTFEIFFPLANRRAKQENHYLPPLPATRGREHVLLIEEDVMVRAMVADIFRANGYTVVAVATTSEALEFLMRPLHKFELLIAQTRAKRTHTEEIFAQILVRSLPAIRILTTGNTDPALFANLNLAQQANLPKPFTLNSLLRAARHLLDVTSFTPAN